jgi:hypothetical protein
MKKLKISLCIAVGCAVSWALVTAYHVDPRTAAMSGWTPWLEPNNYVSEVITVAFSLPITASLFCGSPGAGGGYNVSILTYPGDVQLAHGAADNPGDHAWATCTLYVDRPDSFIKGRQVEVRWTRSGIGA